MPRAFGRDRVTPRDDGTIALASPYPKKWRARVAKTLTTAEFPGTAVLWDEHHYEVIAASETRNGPSEYVLAPWNPSHSIRQREVYDAPSEERRKRFHARDVAHQKHATRFAILAVLTGHLPGWAQKELELEYGIAATRQTMISTIPFFALGTAAAVYLPIQGLPNEGTMPRWVYPIAGLLFVESIIRLRSTLAARPIGSMIGIVFFYLFLRRWFTKKVAVLNAEEADRYDRAQAVPARALAANPSLMTRGGTTDPLTGKPLQARDRQLSSSITTDTPPERVLQDQWAVREPFAALLAAEDQLRIARRFDFDYVRWGNLTAASLLVAATLGIAATLAGAFTATKLLSLAAALFLAGEQLIRLQSLRREAPAPSILRFIFRPWMRPILDAPPRELEPKPITRVELPETWDGKDV